MDPTALTISEAAAAIRRGEMTALAYAEALLAQAEKAASLNAFIHHDPEQVRAAARAADAKGGAGAGPLHGVPLALKDNLDTADMPTTGGTPGLKGHRPKRNAEVVQKLLDAGAIAFGKANLHELAYGITNNNAAFGAARNPYDPTRIPGGSSGGVGAAVGARIVPGGIGSDTGGSVRVPAALCGIVGFRPTTGRWSQAGVVPISHTRDTARADDAQRRRLRPARQRRHRQRRAGGGHEPEGTAARRAARALLEPARHRDGAPDGRRAGATEECRRDPRRGRHRRRRPARQRGRVSDRPLRDGRRPERLPRRPRLAAALCRARGAVREPRRRRPAAEPARRGGDSRGGLSACARRAPAAVAGRLPGSLPKEADRGGRLPDDAAARRADRRRRDGAAQRRARADLLHLHPQLEPGQRRRHPRHQPAGGHDRRRTCRSASSSTRPKATMPACWRSRWRSKACCRSCPVRKSNEEVSHDPGPVRPRPSSHPFRRCRHRRARHRLGRLGPGAAEGIQDRLLHRPQRAGVAVRADAARLRRPRGREDQQGRRHPGPAGQADLHRRRRPARGDGEVGGAPDARGQGRPLHRLARQRHPRGEHRDDQGQGALHLFAGVRRRRVLAERVLPRRDAAAAGAAGDRVPGQGEEAQDLPPDRRRLRLAAQGERAGEEVRRRVRRQGGRRGIRSVRRAEQVRGGGDAHQGAPSPTR